MRRTSLFLCDLPIDSPGGDVNKKHNALVLGAMMDLSFNQVEAVFTERFAIPENRAVAFRGRLQHLQRLNFPSGVNTGRGKKASYGWKQIIQLVVALDLIDFGMTPDAAARSVRQETDRLIDAISKVIQAFETAAALAKALKKMRCPFGITQMAFASAYALTLQRDEDDPAYILVYSGKEFLARLNDDPAVEPAAACINLGSRMMLLGQLVGRVTKLAPLAVATDLIQWTRDWVAQESLS